MCVYTCIYDVYIIVFIHIGIHKSTFAYSDTSQGKPMNKLYVEYRTEPKIKNHKNDFIRNPAIQLIFSAKVHQRRISKNMWM